MIAALIFVAAFVVLGLSVVLAAFGGKRRGRGTAGGPTRAGRRFVVAVFTVMAVGLGIAVPLAVGVVNGDNHAKNAPGGVDLTNAEVGGRATFAKYCSTCHTLGASNAVGKVGPNLDILRPPKGLILDAIAHGRARGAGQMPRNLVVGQDAQDVAAYVAKVAGHGQ